jgi:hypothetical protein
MWRFSWNLGTSISWNTMGLSRPVMGVLYHYVHVITVRTLIGSREPNVSYRFMCYCGGIVECKFWHHNFCQMNVLMFVLFRVFLVQVMTWAAGSDSSWSCGEFMRRVTPADARREGLKLRCVLELQTAQSLLSRTTNVQHVYEVVSKMFRTDEVQITCTNV